MAFDLQGARDAGFSDDEIADYLGKKAGFDTQAARRAGFETRDILAELSSAWAKQELPEGVKPSDAGGGRGRVAPTDEAIPKPTTPKGPTAADLKQGPGAVLENVRQAARPADRIGKGGIPEQKPVIGRDPLSMPNPNFTPGPADLQAGQISDERALREAKQRAYVNKVGAPNAQAPSADMLLGESVAGVSDSPLYRGVAGGVSNLAQTGIGAVRAGADALGLDGVADFAQGASKKAGAVERAATGDLKGNDKLAADIFASITASAPSMAVGVIGGPALKTLFAQSALAEYNTGRNSGFSPEESATRAGIFGMAEALGERFGFPEQIQLLKSIGKHVPTSNLGKVAAEMLAKEIPGEQLTTAMQFMADKFGPAAQNPNATLSDYLDQAGQTLKVTIGQSALMGGGPVAISKAKDTYRAADKAIGGDTSTPMDAEALAKSKGFLADARPVDIRTEAFKRLDDVGAKHGIPSNVLGLIKKAADGKPVEDLTGWIRRALTKLSQTGDIAPVDDATLSLLDQPTKTDTPPSGPAPQGAKDSNADKPGPGQTEAAPMDFSGLADSSTPVDQAAHAAATSPRNDLPEPTEAQKSAGNYAKGHVRIAGIDFAIENPAGSVRRGTAPDGRQWETPMVAHYGYAKGTRAGDGDHSDVFIKPGTDETWTGTAFVIDQIDPKTGKFDEHKTVLGADSEEEAKALYLANYEKGWGGLGAITALPIDAYKSWVKDGVKSKPLGTLPQGPGTAAPVQPAATSTGANDGQGQEGRGQTLLTPEPAVGVTYKAPDGRTLRIYVSTPNRVGVADEKGNKSSIARGSPGWAKMEQAIAASQPKTETALQPAPAVAPVSQPNPAEAIPAADLVEAAAPVEAPAPAPKPAKRPKVRNHPDTVRGSNALAEISRALGGISPDIISDLSQKTTRTRTSAKTDKKTTFTTWDNPAIPGVGPLFRKGGTSDLTEIARVLEDAGYIEAGLVERDYLEARSKAQDIIKAELSQGGSTLRIGDPEAVAAEAKRREEAAAEDWAASDFWSPDDLDATGYTDLGEDERIAADAILADVDALGLDREAIIERAAMEAGDLTTKEYHDVLKRIADEAVQEHRRQAVEADTRSTGQGDQGGGSDAQAPGRPGGDRADGPDQAVQSDGEAEGLTLTSETEAEAKAKAEREAQALADERRKREQEQARLDKEAADREAKARADATVADFQLGQSADQQLSGQADIFSQSEKPAEPQPKTADTPRLTDAGEELIRNRRGKLKGLSWSDVSDLNDTLKVAQVVKANVWPRPDYAKMVEDGAPAWKAAALKAVYDKLAAAPSTRTTPTDADLRAYIETMHSVRDAILTELDRVAGLPDGGELWKSLKAENVFGRVFPLPADARALYGRPSPFDRMSEQGKENNRRAMLIGGNNAVQALQFNSKMLAKVKDLLADGFPAKQEAWQKSYEVRPLMTRDSDVPEAERTGEPQERFYVYEKGSRWRLASGVQDGGFATREQAEAFARSLTVKKKDVLPPSRGLDLADASRTGPDWRGGRNVTAQDIMDRFGFRGVNLGEYVKAKQSLAQAHMNHVYDAFSDLADLLGVPPKAMSLNGTLGVAVGAQGSGKALAHFVPGVNEINITRDSGAGALAHEFGHALDHYFAAQHGKAVSMAKRPYLSAAIDGMRDPGGVRPEVIEAMRFVMKTMNTRPMTEAEAKQFIADQRDLNRRRLDRWIQEFKGNKGSDAKALDAVAEKLKRGDLGEATADGELEPNVAELVRASGLKPGNSIAAHAITVAYRLRDLADESRFMARHLPQKPTDYAKASDAMDAKKREGDGYWSTPWEKFARAFETFVMDALKDRQRESLYLSGLVDSQGWKNWSEETGKSIPYPAGDERLAIQQAFQSLVDTIETREDSSGNVAMAEPSTSYNIEAPRKKYRDERQADIFDQQLEAFAASAPDPSQAGPSVIEARRVAIGALRDIYAGPSVLGRGLSSALAEHQRANLVGQVAKTPADFATIAQIYRDPRFETFRLVFTNDDGRVVSQVGLTSRLPGATSAIVGEDLGAYMSEVVATAKKTGATGYFMLHNHPSGNALASSADVSLTMAMSARTSGEIKFHGHVVIDTNQYTVIDQFGQTELVYKDFGASNPFMDAGEWSGHQITSPADVMSMARRLSVDDDAITLISLSTQHVVKAISTIPGNVVGRSRVKNYGLLSRAVVRMQGAKLIAIGRNEFDLELLAKQGLLLDAIVIDPDGSTRSMANAGTLSSGSPYPKMRSTRVSPDTSPAFSYLRAQAVANATEQQRKASSLRAAEDGANYDSKDVAMLSRPSPTYFSALQRAAEASPMKAGDAGAWRQWLKGITSSGKAKAEEIAWSGLEEWLQLQSGKITKAQVVDFLAANGVRVEEVMLGGERKFTDTRAMEDALIARADRLQEEGNDAHTLDMLVRGEPADRVYRQMRNDRGMIPSDMAREIQEWHDALVDSGNSRDATKYAQYTLPGGTNYREVLLTLPAPDDGGLPMTFDEWLDAKGIDPIDDVVPELRSQYRREVGKQSDKIYQSNHWDQPNILAHIRLNDRTDADGKRVLFVEEIQSDWAQEGKRNGFGTSTEVRDEGLTTITKHGVPAAPFVGKTDAWVALALKRVIKMAVDGGYDKVAFVTGEQSAERYDLSKQVDQLTYEDGVLRAFQNRTNVITKKATPDELPDIIGKEVAQRLLDAPEEDGRRVLMGESLKVGGEGMRAFYDKIVPSVAKDVLRKVGGGQLGTVQIANPEKGRDVIAQQIPGNHLWGLWDNAIGRWVDMDGNPLSAPDGNLMSEKDAKSAADTITRDAKRPDLTQTAFDITPAMREAAAGGLPLFKRAEAANDAGLSASDLQPVADALTSNGVKATVLPSRDQLPPAALAEVKTVDPTGIARGALTSDGQIWLFANRLGSHAEAFEVALHEGFHRGLRLLGDKGSKVLAQIYATNAKVRKLADAYQKDYPDLDREDATNEALADLAGRGEAEKLNYWAALKRLVRDFLRRVADAAGITMEWTDADVTRFVASMSRKGLTNGAHADGGAQLAAGVDQTQTEAFRRWFGDSKVVDDQGKPLVVYHGTKADFTAFSTDNIGDNFGLDKQGFFFTGSTVEASGYADPASQFLAAGMSDPRNKEPASGSNVMPVYLSLQNPLTLDAYTDAFYTNPTVEIDERGVGLVDYFDDNRTSIMQFAADGNHDGVLFRHKGKVLAVALRPEQIKSAIGNRGTFDPASPDIRLSRPPRHTPDEQAALAKAGITPGRTLRQSVVQAWNKAAMLLRNRDYLKLVAQQATLDQFVGIKDVVQRELGGLPVDQDPYITARLANGGAASVMHALLLHGQAKWAANKQHLEKIDGTRGLLDILAPLGDDLNDWFGWMVGNRAERLKREGRENNLTDADIKALQGLASTPEKLTKFRSAAVEYAAFKRSVLDIAEGAGLIDPTGRKVWDNADYIPFYRQIDERSTFTATGKKGLAGQSSGIRVLKGGEAALNDPMENLLMNFSRLIDASLKNNALRKTIQAVDGTWLVTKVGYEMTGQIMPKSQVKKILEDAGTPPDIIDVLPEEAFDGMAKIWAIQAPTDPDVVRVMVGGKPQFYRVDEPVLLRSLTSFVPFDMPGLGAARMFKRLLTSSVTSTPDFLARNFIRDSLATRMISRDAVTVGSAIRGLGRSFAEKGAGEAMLFAGASFQGGQVSAGNIEGSASTVRRALRRKGIHAGAAGKAAVVIDSPARLWDLWTKARDATENANREAVYEAALKAGRGDTLAAFEAKDLMDFSLRGGHPLYQVAADVLPFFNARVQGLYRLARVGGPDAAGKAAVRKFATYAVMMAILSAALAAINAGRDDYNRLPDWEKDTYWHLFVGGQHFKIPKPFELGAMFGTLPERITRYLMGVDTGSKLGHRIGAILHDQLAVDLVPQMFRPALDVYANWDAFRDRPIETTGDEGKIPSQRFDARTSPTATAAVQAVAPLADRVGLSPKRLEYLIGGYLGTVGTYALGGVDIMVRGITDGAPTPSWRADDIPVVKSFYAVDPARATVYESDLYAMREEIEKVYKSIQASLKQEDEAAAEYLRQRFSKELAAREAIKDGADDLATIRKEVNAIYADKTMTPQRKRELIDQLQVERNKIAEQTMKVPEVQALR